jgi:hypothetical protein
MVTNHSSFGTAAGSPLPSIESLTSIFVLDSAPNSKGALLEIPKALAVDPFRQRRAHRKSKGGCESCKRRRIKVITSCDLNKALQTKRQYISVTKAYLVRIVSEEEIVVRVS